MFLKSIKINNFRKFRKEGNKVEFTNSKNYQTNVNVASNTTLIVGKNNSGKTTIINALEKLINKNINVSDFNFHYLKEILEKGKIEIPSIEFNIIIGLEEETENKEIKNNDNLNNLLPFMTLKDLKDKEIEITIKYEIEEEEIFKEEIKKIKKIRNKESRFLKFLKILEEARYRFKYYREDKTEVENFDLGKLIEIKTIKANNIEGEKSLQVAFSKIIKYRYKELIENNEEKENIEKKFQEINNNLTEQINEKHGKILNKALNKIFSKKNLEVSLKADLSFDNLINYLLKYEYVDEDLFIPENQFGLGYTNLMMIVANLIDYMEKYPETSFNSKINLICIEEPETYMHPQMQEMFIKYINDVISELLKSHKKNINSQLIISTHSSHILNSKIQFGGSFDSINYIISLDKKIEVIPLKDELISFSGRREDEDFKFIKKHIKFKVSDLFFSDAVILVEGITEYNLLPYYVDKDENLKKYYISLFNINGDYALVYKKLLKLLKIPVLIFTDLDIERIEDEKKSFSQIESLENKTTTNPTLTKFNNSKNISNLPEYLSEENISIYFQRKINEYYPTSFEEALILTNFNNPLLNTVLREIKPKIYEEIVKSKFENNKHNSYKWQKKLKNEKSEFSNKILYNLIITDNNDLKLPNYMEDGLKDLLKRLEKNGRK